MSEVLDYVREKDPRLKDVPDDDLTLFIGSKKPDFLKDPGFKGEFAKAAGEKSLNLALQGTGNLLKVLSNPAAGEASATGQEQLKEIRGTIEAGVNLSTGMTGKVENLLSAGATGSAAGRDQLNFIRQEMLAGSGGALPTEISPFEGLNASQSLSKSKLAFAKLAGEAVAEATTRPLAEVMPKVSSADLEKLLGFMSTSMPMAIARERAAGATPEERENEPGMHPEQMLTPEARRLMQGVAGLEQSAADQVNFFTSPLGIATLGMGELPPLVAKLVGTAFTLKMAHDAPKILGEIGSELGKPESERDYEKIYKLSGDFAATVGFTAAGGLHMMEPVVRSTRGYLAYRKAIREAFPVAPFTATALDNTVGTQYTGAGPLSPPVRLPEGPKEPPAAAGTTETPKEKGKTDERPEDQKQATGEVSTVQGKPAEQSTEGQAEAGTTLGKGEDQGQQITPELIKQLPLELKEAIKRRSAAIAAGEADPHPELDKDILEWKAGQDRVMAMIKENKMPEPGNADLARNEQIKRKYGDKELADAAAAKAKEFVAQKENVHADQPPKSPKHVKGQSFEEHMQAMDDYEKAVEAWEAKQPKNKPLIFQHENRVVAITPDFNDPEYPWRATSFSNTDHAPIGHDVFKTRAEAVRAQHGADRIQKIPFQVEALPIRAFPGDKVTWRRPGAEPVVVEFAGYSKEPGKAFIKDPETGETRTIDSMDLGPKPKPAAEAIQKDIAEKKNQTEATKAFPEVTEKGEASPKTPEGTKPLKRRIKQNAWGNWNGYEGNKKVQDFGTDEQAAKEWFEAGPKEQRSPTAINRDIKKTKANIRALRSAKRNYEKAKDKGAAARVQEKIQEYENKLTEFNQELSQLGTVEDKRVGQAMRRFNRETQENGPDVLSEIAEKHKVMSWSQFVEAAKTKGQEWFNQNKSEYDDIRNVKLPPHINAAIYGGDALPNVVAKSVLGEGKTASDLWTEVKHAADVRRGLAEGKGSESKVLSQEEQQQIWNEATGPKEGRTEVDPSIISPGEVYVVDGQELKVTAKDPNTGNLTIDGGKKFGEMIVRETEPFWVDEVKEVHEGQPDFLPPEDQAQPPAAKAPEAPKAPETPKKLTGGELFASEEIPFNLTGEKTSGGAPEKPKTEAAAQGDLLGGEAPKKEEPALEKPKVEERPLTEPEKEEFLELSKKLRANREEGGPGLTTEETQRYEYLTALAGQKDFGFSEPTGPEAIKGKIKAIASQIQRLDEAMPKGSGKKKQEYLEQRRKLHQEMRDLMDKLTEGQGEVIYTSDPKEMPSGYYASREFRVRQLSDEEVQDRWRDPASRMEVFKVAGTRPYVAESRRVDFNDANATQEAGKGNWYADGYGKTRDTAIGDARGRKGSAWSKIPEEAVSPKPAEPAGEPAAESTTPITEQKFRIGNNPTTYTLLERLDQTDVEKANNEQPVRVRNDNTGKEEILMEGDLTPVKTKSAAEKAKAKGDKRDLDKELRDLGLDPTVFKTKAEKQAAIIREHQKKQGPGTPHITQPPDPKAQIEQLEESFRNIRGRKVPLLERVKAMFSMGQQIAAAKDFMTEAIAGLKTTGDYLISKWEGYGQLDDLLRAKGELSAEIEKNGWRMKHFVKTILDNVPDPMQRAAIAKWVDAGGDMEKLIAGYEEAPQKYKQHYLDAMDLSGDLLVGAMNLRNYFDARLQEAIDLGVLKQGVEDYIHRIYEKTPQLEQKMLNYVQTGLLRTNPALAKKRFFDHDWEAERAGYAVVQDFLPRITEYEAALSRAIASRKFVRKIIGYEDAAGNKIPAMLAPDGRPVIDVAGEGVPLQDQEGVREGSLIKPSFKSPGKTISNIDPDTGLVETYEDPLTVRKDYVERNQYPVFRQWKWAVNDSAGNPIYVQGDVVIHPDFVGRFDKLLEPSRIRYAKNPVWRVIGRGALGAGSFVKQSMLDLSGFHQVQMAVHGAEHRVWTLPGEVPVGIKQMGFEKILQDIDLNDPRVDNLLKGGMTLGGDYHYGSEGLVGRSLTRWIPPLNKVMHSYHQWLFQDFIPRLKTTMALSALDRNIKVFEKDLATGKRTMEDVYNITANEANAAFGELNQITLERSKTMQDALRLIFLAPDFLEARGRFAAQAATKYGAEQRWALAFGALGMWGFARIMNLALDGQMHNEPENLFSVVYKGRSYGLRTVQGDILHFMTAPTQFWMSRLNPLFGRTVMEKFSGRDYFGRKRSTLEQAWDAVSTVIPATLRHSQEHVIWESMLNAFGVTSRRFSDVDDAFKLAQKWKDKHGVGMKGEFIYDPNKDDLRGLKIALSNGDEARSVKEIQNLIKSGKYSIGGQHGKKSLDEYFDRYASMPLAGSQDNDKKFIQTLSADQKKTVQGAMQHKKAMNKLYRQARSQYNGAIRGPATKVDESLLNEPTPQVQ